ncbi:MAG: hypothetical protein J6U87_02025, partial [Clostridia bacterium]|nr:hypothetical protein [Clostridia bacterium]
MSNAWQMARSSALYFAGRGLSGVVTMLLLPLYTTHIDTAAYGYYETASSVVIVLVPVLCLEVWTGMLKYTLARRAGACPYGEEEIYGAAFLLLACGSAVFVLGCTAVYLFHPFRCFGWVLASGISLALCCGEGYVARCEQKNATYAASGVLGAIASATAGIVGVYALKMQAQALFAAYVAGNAAQILWLESQNKLFLGRKLSFAGVDRALLFSLVRFCAPLGLNAAVFYLMNNFNKVIINAVLGESAVGIFSVVGKFMAVAATVAVAIEYAWAELTFSLGERADK